jgi:hypothetical protein
MIVEWGYSNCGGERSIHCGNLPFGSQTRRDYSTENVGVKANTIRAQGAKAILNEDWEEWRELL